MTSPEQRTPPCSVTTRPPKPSSARRCGPGSRPIFRLRCAGAPTRPPPAELMPWYQTLSRKGWIAPHWPKQYGGMGATLNEQIIMTEELARVGAPHLPVAGPQSHRPDPDGVRQRRRRRRSTCRRSSTGTVIWAQGYSEPGAGSDLASLATRADARGRPFRGERARRSGPPGAIIRTGCSRWCAPTRRRSPVMPASASC